MKNKTVALIISVGLLILIPSLPAFCQALPAAIYYGSLYPNTNNNPPGFVYAYGPGVYSASWNPTSSDNYAIGTLTLAPGFPPSVTVSCRTKNQGGYYPQYYGWIKYFLQVTAKDFPVPNVTSVPVLIKIKASVSHFFAPDTWYLTDPTAGATVSFNNETLANIYVNHNDPSGTIKSVDFYTSRPVLVDNIITILINAGGMFDSSPHTSDAGFYAFVDPIISIDPSFMVEVNGKLIPGTQLFKLKFSPGFNPVSCSPMLNLLLLD